MNRMNSRYPSTRKVRVFRQSSCASSRKKHSRPQKHPCSMTFSASLEFNKPTARVTVEYMGDFVANVDPQKWEEKRADVAYEAVRQQFVANEELTKRLLETENATLAEISEDKVWGTGLKDNNDPRMFEPHMWPGENLLGRALMRTRDYLRQQKGQADTPPMAAMQYSYVLPGYEKGSEEVNQMTKNNEESFLQQWDELAMNYDRLRAGYESDMQRFKRNGRKR